MIRKIPIEGITIILVSEKIQGACFKILRQPCKDPVVLIIRRMSVQILHAGWNKSNQKLNRCNTKAFRQNPLICAIQTILMKPSLLVLICIFFLALGCSKDNNQAAPSIKVKSYTGIVPPDGNFDAVLTYSQKNGNLSGDTLFVIRHRYNLKPVPPDNQTTDSFNTIMPVTPNASSAEFSVDLSYSNIHIDNGENDTIDFRFILKDMNGKLSDTAATGKIVLLQ